MSDCGLEAGIVGATKHTQVLVRGSDTMDDNKSARCADCFGGEVV
jgi:hypothetical protein